MTSSWFFRTDQPYSDQQVAEARTPEERASMLRANASAARYNEGLGEER